MITYSSLLHQVLVYSYQCTSVSTWNVWYCFDLSSHHQHCTLNGFNIKIILATWFIVRSHNSDFLSSTDNTREDSTKGIESTFVISRYHLRDEDHERTFLVTCLYCLTTWVIYWSFIQVCCSVVLSFNWRG